MSRPRMVSPTVRSLIVLKSVKLFNVSLMDWIPTLVYPDMHDDFFVGFGVGLWVGRRVGLCVGSRVEGLDVGEGVGFPVDGLRVDGRFDVGLEVVGAEVIVSA